MRRPAPGYLPSSTAQVTTGRGSRVQVRVRLGTGLSRLCEAPLLTVELADGATVDELLERLRDTDPGLAPALRSALPVVAGEHVPRDRRLADREQIALLLPVSGG